MITARGGLRIKPPANLRPVAFETTTRDSWSNRVALCLPEDARTNIRVVLRQLKAAREESPSLAAWLAAYDRSDANGAGRAR